MYIVDVVGFLVIILVYILWKDECNLQSPLMIRLLVVQTKRVEMVQVMVKVKVILRVGTVHQMIDLIVMLFQKALLKLKWIPMAGVMVLE